MSEYTCVYAKRKIEESEDHGLELFFLSTTPSRELTALPWTDKIKPLTNEILEDVFSFYKDEIKSFEDLILANKSKKSRLETYIIKCEKSLFDQIEEEIEEIDHDNSSIQDDIDELKYHLSMFEFAKSIIDDNVNSEYELIYIKC